MTTIDIVNLKGGTGKTTTAANMATILAEDYGYRVVLIDADAQANSTSLFLPGQKDLNDLSLLMDEGGYNADFIYNTAYPNLSIVPASINLNSFDLHLAGTDRWNTLLSSISNFCDTLRQDGDVDYVIIDCPPSFSLACISAIMASDEVIIPIKLDKYSFTGLRYLTKQIEQMQQEFPTLKIRGGLITSYYSNSLNIEAAAALRQAAHVPIFKQVIRRSPKADESTWADEPVCQFSRTSAAGRDYRKFVLEYLRGEAGR